MGNGPALITWGAWLRRLVDRDGWSIARLARESSFNPATISEWIRYQDGGYVKVRDVVAIARAAGEDPVEALCAAAGIDSGHEEDPVIRQVRSIGLSPEHEAAVIATIYARRERDLERQRQDTGELAELLRDLGGQPPT